MERYIEPTRDAAAALFTRGLSGPVVMLNLLRFREVADYSETPGLEPPGPLSGREAYDLYIAHTTPFLHEAQGELLFIGEGGPFFIGPIEKRWDLVLLVKHQSLDAFRTFAANPDYLAGIGHRTAALEDSRLLPIVES